MQSKTTTTSTYIANLLQKCIDNKALKPGKLLHAQTLRLGHSSDTFLTNRLIELYSKCGYTKTASHLFEKMPQRNIYSFHAMLSAYCKQNQLRNAYELFVSMPEKNGVSYNTLISAMSRNGYERKALEVYLDMNLEGFVPTRFTLASVLSACGGVRDEECGRECHGVAVKLGLEKNVYVGNALLGMYSKCECMRDAFEVFRDLPEHNEVSFTTMMGGLVDSGKVEEALNMFRLMHRNGTRIDSVSLSSVLGACSRERNGSFTVNYGNDWDLWNVEGKLIHGLTIKLGFGRDLHLCNSLLDMYAKCGEMEIAEMLFNNLSEVSTVSWNVMIGGYGQKYEKGKAMEYMQRMQSCGFEPDEVTYVNMLAACVRCGDVESARQIFDRMACPSLNSWNAMLSGYLQNEYHREAVSLFRDMQFRNIQFDRTTLAIILSSCAGITFLVGGKEVHSALTKSPFHTDVYVASGLVGLYSKCSKIEEAKRVFAAVPYLDIVCWNSMIAGLSLNSLDEEAFTFFKQMLATGMLPTEFSYATALSCCAKLSSSSQGKQIHCQITKDGYANDVFVGSALIDMYCKCGDVDGARQFFDIMLCKNTVTWNEMIHGYAQSGCGDEAVCLYEEMILSGAKPDNITFVTVLTACSHSGLVDFGIKIFNSMHSVYGVEPLSDHYTCIIDSLGRAGRFHELEEVIDKLPYKDDPIIWEVLLSSCRVHANVTLARRAANELFLLDPNNSAPYVLLANMYASLGRWDDAKNVREMMSGRQVSKDPGYSWVDHSKGIFAFEDCITGMSSAANDV